MNKSVKYLCCVCSGCGEHDVFGRIPVNVHANPNEFRFWKETIAEMIADISSIYITKDEKNYPQRICTVCLSYLKHAMVFRRQVINNDRCVRQQTFYPGSEPFNVKMLMPNDFTNIGDDINLAPEAITFDSLKIEIEEAFGGECIDSDDDETDEPPMSNTLFNYKEKSFTEDDISAFVNGSVIITIPDEMRERKCDACKQRFMLKESFDQHLKECIELKLNKFIMEGYQLLTMRKSRALSANEFNRRMIFALKKMVKSLTSCYKEVSETVSTNVDDKATKKNNMLDSCDISLNIKKLNTDTEQAQSLRSPNLWSSLEGKPNVSIQRNHLMEHNQYGGHSFVANENGENNDQMNVVVSSSTPISSQFKLTDNGNGHEESMLEPIQFEKTPTKIKQRNRIDFTTVVAQCSQCNQSFSSLQQFEEHIRKNHNTKSSQPSYNNQTQSPLIVDERNDTLNPDERNTLLQMLTNSTIKF